MNSQGYTKDNIHKGNTKIVAGGIDVDGLIRIGDQSVGGDGYVLPAVKGTEGQVLTMNADKTTSFQDVGGDVATGRLIQNFFQMTNPTTSFNPSNFRELYTNKNGSDIITTADIDVGSSVRFRSKGYLYNGNLGQTAFGQFRLRIGVPNTSSTFDFYSNNQLFIRDVGMSAGDPNVGRGWWEINVTITKIDASNNCTIGVSGIYNCVASTGVTSDTFDIQFYDNDTTFTTRLPNNSSSNTIIPAPFWSALPATFQVELAWKQIAFDANAIATEYTIDYLNVGQEVLATTTAPATDHNSLANLNVGDPHQLYAYLGGRSGGQVLSGGITNLHNLTLKSHTAGLNNIVIKDLNTAFEKNIDMNSNDVDSVSNINMVNDGNSEISNVFRINGSSVNSLYMIGNLFSATASTQDILFRCINTASCIRFKFGTSATPNRIFICDTDVDCFVPLIMNSNDINDVANINIDDNGRIENNNNGYSLRNSRDGPTDNIFIAPTENIFFKALNLQSGVNIIFPFANNQIGHPFIGNKLQALWVNSINGFTPFGGLFSGTSDSPILTASTAEQSILPATFVGTTLVPPNGFSNGDSFHCVLAGDFGSHNGDTLTIRLKAGPTSTTILGTLVVPLNNSTASSFEIEIDFQIRNIGGAGVADIVTNFDFTYNQSGGGGAFVGERGVFQNNTTFDTTGTNILEITAQFSSTNANNTIKTVVSKLSKDF